MKKERIEVHLTTSEARKANLVAAKHGRKRKAHLEYVIRQHLSKYKTDE